MVHASESTATIAVVARILSEKRACCYLIVMPTVQVMMEVDVPGKGGVVSWVLNVSTLGWRKSVKSDDYDIW